MEHWEHVIALTFLGIGGLYLMYLEELVAGAALLGTLGGYAFKNGIKRKSQPP